MTPIIAIEEAVRYLSDWIEKSPSDVVAQKVALDRYGKYFHPEPL